MAEIKVRFDVELPSRTPLTCIQACIIALIRHFSFTCPYDIEAFQSFVVRPRVKGEGPSSLPLVVRKIAA
jgi:hypothetical protein